MFKTVYIQKNQRGLVFKQGDIVQVLAAGEHRLFDWGNKLTVEILPLEQEISSPKLIEALHYAPAAVQAALVCMETDANQLALGWFDGKLTEVFAAKQRIYYWKDATQRRYELVDTRMAKMSDAVLALFDRKTMQQRHVKGLDQVLVFEVAEGYFGLVSQGQQLLDVLAKGRYGYYQSQQGISIEVLAISEPVRQADDMNKIRQALQVAAPELVQSIQLIETQAQQVGLRFVDQVLVEVIAPNQRLYLVQQQAAVRVDLIDVTEAKMSAEVLAYFNAGVLQQQKVQGLDQILVTDILADHVGVVKTNGQVTELLGAGRVGYFTAIDRVQVEILDLRMQELEVSGQEILTKDKVTLRVNLTANWQYLDVMQAYAKQANPSRYVYVVLQFALREVIGTRTLDELLENKQQLDSLLKARVEIMLQDMGVAVLHLGVKDLILPGDMRTILSQVVEAQKAAEANVVRRREETAATRSLLNTAKVMEDNPVALRLKELETLEKMAERIDRISVFGGLDQVLNGLIKIETPQQSSTR
ncbi:MAG: slipin family protein [Pseudomonadota bacterium]|nr:slipin family protein [Pseudomonadota bacterium]